MCQLYPTIDLMVDGKELGRVYGVGRLEVLKALLVVAVDVFAVVPLVD